VPAAISLLVFDLDGTLLDTRKDLADAANELIIESGGAPLDETAIGRMVGEGAALLVRRALSAAGLEPTPASLPRFLEIYDRLMLVHTRPYPGVEAVLRHFDGRVPMAVLTNKPQHSSVRLLDAFDLRSHLFDVVGGDGPLGRKPSPDGLARLAARANVTREATLLVGDSRIDFETASAAGTRVCLARYGFGYEGFPVERLTGEELTIDRPEELIEKLRM
jgi:phosphoglycolate phosphatase